MAEKSECLIEKLQKGEKILCPQCKKSCLTPYNPFNSETFEGIYNFFCPDCDFHCHADPILDIE